MLQEIIAYLIIAVAFSILALNILRFFNLVGKKTVNSSKCGGCSSGCEMKELHLTGKARLEKQDQYKFYL
jgi:hypothetical protein